jgi:hypothetical protein
MANEAPSLTKATYIEKRTRGPAPSPIRRQAALDEAARDSAFSRELHTDPASWVRKYVLKKRVSGEPKPPEPSMKRRF